MKPPSILSTWTWCLSGLRSQRKECCLPVTDTQALLAQGSVWHTPSAHHHIFCLHCVEDAKNGGRVTIGPLLFSHKFRVKLLHFSGRISAGPRVWNERRWIHHVNNCHHLLTAYFIPSSLKVSSPVISPTTNGNWQKTQWMFIVCQELS